MEQHKILKTSNYKIAGKTGTAQVADKSGGYRTQRGVVYRASFVGYFPADNPQYSMIVVVHNPKGWVYSGSHVAAPVFRRIADRLYASHLQFPKEVEEESQTAWLPSFRMANIDDLTKIYSLFDCKIPYMPVNPWVQTVVNNDTVTFREREFVENLVPNVVGMGLSDALFVLENVGLRVKFVGKGLVRKQSIAPGVRISDEAEIFIELS